MGLIIFDRKSMETASNINKVFQVFVNNNKPKPTPCNDYGEVFVQFTGFDIYGNGIYNRVEINNTNDNTFFIKKINYTIPTKGNFVHPRFELKPQQTNLVGGPPMPPIRQSNTPILPPSSPPRPPIRQTNRPSPPPSPISTKKRSRSRSTSPQSKALNMLNAMAKTAFIQPIKRSRSNSSKSSSAMSIDSVSPTSSIYSMIQGGKYNKTIRRKYKRGGKSRKIRKY